MTRKMTWVLIVWCGLMGGWIAYAAAKTHQCVTQTTGQFAGAGRAGCEAGGGVAVGIIGVIAFMGFVVLALIWFMTRPSEPVAHYQPPYQQAYVQPQPPSVPPPGWYAAPGRTMRWWDGQGWTQHVRPRGPGEV